MIVMKFGGSSLSSKERIQESLRLVRDHLDRRPVLVLSAMGKTTDRLVKGGVGAYEEVKRFHLDLIAQLEIADTGISELLHELKLLLKQERSAKVRDAITSFGERLSVRLFSNYLNAMGIAAAPLDGWEAGIVTSSDFMEAAVLPQTYERVKERLSTMQGVLPVVTGFIGKDIEGNVTTLGRGGSDLTASVLGNALNVEEILLWKDVYGILAADPRIVERAKPLQKLSFAEASELAYFGAKVLHPSSILPAMAEKIPVRVKNYFDPTHEGTLIVAQDFCVEGRVVGIAHKRDQVLVHITSTRMLGQWGFLAAVFQIFADLKLSVDVVATSEVSISLTLGDREHFSELTERLEHIATVQINRFKGLVSLVGKVSRSAELLERVMCILNRDGIDVQMISYGASKMNTSLIIDDCEVERCVQTLYKNFFEEEGTK